MTFWSVSKAEKKLLSRQQKATESWYPNDKRRQKANIQATKGDRKLIFKRQKLFYRTLNRLRYLSWKDIFYNIAMKEIFILPFSMLKFIFFSYLSLHTFLKKHLSFHFSIFFSRISFPLSLWVSCCRCFWKTDYRVILVKYE